MEDRFGKGWIIFKKFFFSQTSTVVRLRPKFKLYIPLWSSDVNITDQKIWVKGFVIVVSSTTFVLLRSLCWTNYSICIYLLNITTNNVNPSCRSWDTVSEHGNGHQNYVGKQEFLNNPSKLWFHENTKFIPAFSFVPSKQGVFCMCAQLDGLYNIVI